MYDRAAVYAAFRESYNLCKPPVIGSYSTPFKAGVGRHFDPRSPRGERRRDRGSTCYAPNNFYPRSPRGERRCSAPCAGQTVQISIHAPREGSDFPEQPVWAVEVIFLSTLPARGATKLSQAHNNQHSISIHAPREGSDQSLLLLDLGQVVISIHAPREGSDFPFSCNDKGPAHFYPRSPRGERHVNADLIDDEYQFLSTLPARGATIFAHTFPFYVLTFLSTLPARGATPLRTTPPRRA